MWSKDDRSTSGCVGRPVEGGLKRRGGRARVAPALQTRPFILRLTDSERDLVRDAAFRRLGRRRSAAAWARAVVVRAALLELEKEPECEVDGLLVLALGIGGRCGNNQGD